MKIMASSPITSWEIDGETVETMSDFILGGSQITADGDCSHEIKKFNQVVMEYFGHLSGPIISWEIDGETVETMSDFILGGSKITADCDCSHEIKTLTPWKKSYDQPK